MSGKPIKASSTFPSSGIVSRRHKSAVKLLKNICLIFLILLSPITKADEATCSAACQQVIEAYKAENGALRDLNEANEAYVEKLKKQRDEAYDKIDTGGHMPFYFWVVMGVAGGVVLTRGIR
jgi:hypothetical protein